MKIQNLKVKILFYTTVLISSILLFDWIIFSFLFLKFPNEMEWDTSPWYNFIQKKANIEFDKNKTPILVTGSSVALYSYLPQKVDEESSKIGLNTQSEFFGHVAMSPTDLYYYTDEMITKKPEMVLYLLNPGDLQMDYFLKGKDGFKNFDEEHKIEHYPNRYPVKYIYPFRYLSDHFWSLNKAEILRLLTKSILYVNKYRSFIKEPIETYIDRHFSVNKSYHNYTGVNLNPIQWRKGWTDKQFEVQCQLKKKNEFLDTVFIPEDNTELTIKNGSTELFRNLFNKNGWHKVQFPIPEKLQSEVLPLNFEVSKVVSSKVIDKKIYGKEYFFGIRLSQNFCKTAIEANISYTRSDSMDDQVLEQMSDEEYKSDYFEKMYKDADVYKDEKKQIPLRLEIQRLYHLHQVKKYLSTKGGYRWSELEYIKKSAEKFKKANIKFIVVNNPENPLELVLYQNSEWYLDYLQFFEKLSSKTILKFYDKKNALTKMQSFIDSHHLTYKGSLQMSPIYAEIIKENIQ